MRRGPKADQGGRWLALVPVGVAVLMLLLVMPRATEPHAVPLPTVDERALARTVAEDEARAAAARRDRLPTDILAVGSALRAFNEAQAAGERDRQVAARRALDVALAGARVRGGEEIPDLLALRAVELEGFLAEVSRFEATGEASKELESLAGPFVRRMRDVGWIDGRRVLLTTAQRRVAFKIVWNAETGLQAPPFAPTLDEQRALYRLYLAHPHAPEAKQLAIDAQRRAATTEAECERAEAYARRAVELWRAEKVQRLGELDPTYPTLYALGVVYYRAGRYDLSADAFRAWTSSHPDGPWAMRARNHLRAALVAYDGP